MCPETQPEVCAIPVAVLRCPCFAWLCFELQGRATFPVLFAPTFSCADPLSAPLFTPLYRFMM